MIRHHVVFGVLVRDRSALLVHRRADNAFYPDVWDLPGGHVEVGEEPADAVRRELREELGIEAGEVTLLAVPVITAPDAETQVYAVTMWKGKPTNAAPEEHDEIRWVPESELSRLSLAVPEIATLVRAAVTVAGSDSMGAPSRKSL